MEASKKAILDTFKSINEFKDNVSNKLPDAEIGLFKENLTAATNRFAKISQNSEILNQSLELMQKNLKVAGNE